MNAINDDRVTSRKIEYHAPAPDVIEAFGWGVCRALGEAYATDEIVRGFITFVQVVVAIQIKYLNREKEQLLDNEGQ